MVKISFLGGTREIGRSGILIESKNGEKCILDYGIGFNTKERLPLETDLSNLKAIAFTHSHIDHSGAIPFLYKNRTNIPCFTNSISLAITEILLKDMIKISNFLYPFGFQEIESFKKNTIFLKNNTRTKIGENFNITFIEAGHIPGSVSILLEVDNKTILYTGDFNTQITNLINQGSYLNIPPLDVLITESTYALKNHPPRKKSEEEFVDRTIQIINNGGKVLVPAFGVARSQEALLILDKYNYNGQIFIDGLARKVSNIFLQYPEFLKDFKAFKKVIKKSQFVLKKKDRIIAKKSNGVVIAPSGMLKGGAAIEYMKMILEDPVSAIYLVGYQVEGSPGRTLLDNGFFEFNESKKQKSIINNFRLKAKCDYDYFDFSSHVDGIELRNFINNINFRDNNNKNVFCVHGDNKSTTSLANELVEKGYNSVAPELGEAYIF